MLWCVHIRPLGFVESETLDRIATGIENTCGLRCRIQQQTATPQAAYDKKRAQYNSKLIVKQLLKTCSKDVLALMGVTHVDLFVPILKYVYGLAQLDGQCSVISLHRLHPEFYNQPSDPERLLSRVEKTALHELGHCLGLTHCRNPRCVMYSSTKIEDTDKKNAHYCPTCSELFQWHLRKKDDPKKRP